VIQANKVDHVLVVLPAPLPVVHVPTQGLEERVNELDAHLGLFVRGLLVMVQVALKAFDQLQDLGGWGQFVFPGWWLCCCFVLLNGL